MQLTLQIKLLPTCKQVEMLKDTFSVFNKACNAISQIAWERRVFKQFGLHKEVYYPIKETYRLSSQLVVRAISKVADADINAARNIATWGYVNTHERWELLSCSIHDDISTSKAHKSLVYG